MMEVGRLCLKIAGRDAGMKCVIVEVIDDNFAESVSIPIKVFIDVDGEDPVAAFTSQPAGDQNPEKTTIGEG